MLANLIKRSVVIISEQGSDQIDEAGNEVEVPVSIETAGEVQPRSSDENATHPDIADSDYVGYFLPADIEHLDSGSEVWVPGLGTYEIDGEPLLRTNPRTQIDSHIEVGLSRVAGPQDDRSEP